MLEHNGEAAHMRAMQGSFVQLYRLTAKRAASDRYVQQNTCAFRIGPTFCKQPSTTLVLPVGADQAEASKHTSTKRVLKLCGNTKEHNTVKITTTREGLVGGEGQHVGEPPPDKIGENTQQNRPMLAVVRRLFSFPSSPSPR